MASTQCQGLLFPLWDYNASFVLKTWYSESITAGHCNNMSLVYHPKSNISKPPSFLQYWTQPHSLHRLFTSCIAGKPAFQYPLSMMHSTSLTHTLSRYQNGMSLLWRQHTRLSINAWNTWQSSKSPKQRSQRVFEVTIAIDWCQGMPIPWKTVQLS